MHTSPEGWWLNSPCYFWDYAGGLPFLPAKDFEKIRIFFLPCTSSFRLFWESSENSKNMFKVKNKPKFFLGWRELLTDFFWTWPNLQGPPTPQIFFKKIGIGVNGCYLTDISLPKWNLNLNLNSLQPYSAQLFFLRAFWLCRFFHSKLYSLQYLQRRVFEIFWTFWVEKNLIFGLHTSPEGWWLNSPCYFWDYAGGLPFFTS